MQDTLKAAPLYEIDASTLDDEFTLLNDEMYDNQIVRLHIINSSDSDVFISYNGTDAQDVVLSNDDITIIPQQSAVPNNKIAVFSRNLQVYCSAKDATGYVYVAAYYL